MEPTLTTGEEILGEEDCFAVLQELEAVAHRWYDIGLALGFTDTGLALVRGKAQNSSDIYELLRIMIVEWLKRTYNTNRFGPPTWRRIVDAVRAKPGGRNPSLAENLEIKYCGKTASHKKQRPVILEQPMTHMPPPTSSPVATLVPSSSGTPRANPEVHTDSCCCFGSGNTQRSSSYRIIERQGIPNREGSDFILPQKTSVRYNIPKRHFSTSLPSHSRDSKHERSVEKSVDTVLAHPTWQIKDVATQEGYVGVMTADKAEENLRRCSGNCYLIRYSESKRSYILSVVRRDAEHRIPHIQHYKLIITKEDGKSRDSVYEIEGSEKRFSDVTKLLKFYQSHPLTRSNRTIGKAYVKPPEPATILECHI